MSDTKTQVKTSLRNKTTYVLIIIIVALIILFAPVIPYYYEVKIPNLKTQTYTDVSPVTVRETTQFTQQKEETLIDEKPTVRYGDYVYYVRYIEVSGKTNNIVYGSVVETAGYDINFYVVDQKNFNAWLYGGSPVVYYVYAPGVNSRDFSFVPDHSDYYYFILDNTSGNFTNKVPHLTVRWSYYTTVTQTITTTQYTTVEKITVITEYQTETRTKFVSLFQILTGTVMLILIPLIIRKIFSGKMR